MDLYTRASRAPRAFSRSRSPTAPRLIDGPQPGVTDQTTATLGSRRCMGVSERLCEEGDRHVQQLKTSVNQSTASRSHVAQEQPHRQRLTCSAENVKATVDALQTQYFSPHKKNQNRWQQTAGFRIYLICVFAASTGGSCRPVARKMPVGGSAPKDMDALNRHPLPH